jgi:hypothetical protein
MNFLSDAVQFCFIFSYRTPGNLPESWDGIECTGYVIVRFCSVEQTLVPVFREFSAEVKDYGFRKFRKSPFDRRAQQDYQDMATWLGHDRHPPGDPTVTPIGNAGPVKDSAKGQPAAGLAPHWDPNLVIAGVIGTAVGDERLWSFLQSAPVLVT